jgi:hypothetical protein
VKRRNAEAAEGQRTLLPSAPPAFFFYAKQLKKKKRTGHRGAENSFTLCALCVFSFAFYLCALCVFLLRQTGEKKKRRGHRGQRTLLKLLQSAR